MRECVARSNLAAHDNEYAFKPAQYGVDLREDEQSVLRAKIRRTHIMRKFRKTMLAAVVAAAAVSAVMSGCSKSKDAETTAAAESSSEAETESETLSADAQAIADIAPVKPESMGTVKLADIKSLEINAPIAEEVSDDAVNDMISYYLSMGGETKEVDSAAVLGDTVNIDYVGKMDGKEFDGGSAEGYDLSLGSGTFIEGFEDGLVGHKAGDSVTLNLTFPEDYSNEELAGKPVVFEVKVNSVSQALTYEDLTDELASTYSGGEYTTAEAYRTAMRDYLEKSSAAYAKNELITNAVNAAVKASDVEVTDAAIGWAIDVYIQNADLMFKNYSASYGLSDMNGLAEYLSSMGQTYEEYRTSLEADAKTLAEQTAVVDEIAKEQGLEYNEDTFNQYLADFGYEEQAEQVKANNTEAALQQTVVQYLVGKYISETAKVNYVSEDEYNKIVAAEYESIEAEESSAANETSAADAAETTAK